MIPKGQSHHLGGSRVSFFALYDGSRVPRPETPICFQQSCFLVQEFFTFKQLHVFDSGPSYRRRARKMLPGAGLDNEIGLLEA